MKRFQSILCVVSAQSTSKPVLARALEVAEGSQANLTVASVVERVTAGIRLPDGGPISKDLQAAMVRDQEQRLHDLIAALKSRVKPRVKVIMGVPFLEIIREVLGARHDLLIKLAEPQGWVDRLLGSDDMHLLRKCPCPVWMSKREAPKALRRVLASVDVDDAGPKDEVQARRTLNLQILDLAAAVALADSAELHVVHAWYAIGESVMRGALMNTTESQVDAYVDQVRRQRKSALNELMRQATAQLGQDAIGYLNPQTHLVQGFPHQEIPALATRIDPDLLVMGTVARTGVPGFFMGNTAETILNHIDCSVLAIKPEGFVTPIEMAD